MTEKQIIVKMENDVIESTIALETTVKNLAPKIARVSLSTASCIKRGGKILVCGNGGSAADAQHFAAELMGRFLVDREPYPAIALSTDTSILTSLSNDYGFESIFERQVAALGRKNDVLLAISTSGNSPNVIRALKEAKRIGMKTVGLTGKGGGKMAKLVDVLLDADSTVTPRIQETHGFIIHTICDAVERVLNERK